MDRAEGEVSIGVLVDDGDEWEEVGGLLELEVGVVVIEGEGESG
jgi:hypothetical protein